MSKMTMQQKVLVIRKYFESYMKKAGLKSAILGMSGGIDSALIAALVSPVCKANGWNLIGVMLPSVTNKQEENVRAANICKHFCTSTFYHPIDDLVESFSRHLGLGDRPSVRIRRGNIKARTRMMFLYDYAASENGIVLSTDNYTELMLGFWTLHGDVGDLALIQNIWKMEVYEMTQSLASNLEDKDAAKALMDCFHAVPTDGLGITNSDLDQLGSDSYGKVDRVLQEYLSPGTPMAQKDKLILESPVIQRHVKSAFKRDNPHNMPLPKSWRD